MTKATLFYIIGASGAGKDTLMHYAQERVDQARFHFVRRYITRPACRCGEIHTPLSETQFGDYLAQGRFVMHWESHGLRYGIVREIDDWLDRGCHVVMNGSRAYLPQAAQRYPDLIPVLIEVSPELLETRLAERGRECHQGISRRVSRAAEYERVQHPNLVRIDNNGPLSQGGDKLVRLLMSAETGCVTSSAT